MIRAFTLALRYIRYHRLRTGLLVAAITLTLLLPVATRWTIERFRSQALQRAQATPLVIGAKGSSLALTLHALYFRGETPPIIAYSQRSRVDALQLGQTVPILARFRAQNHLIVGTSEQYLSFRNLTLAAGEPLERWGDCLVGWRAAQELGLQIGDDLLSEPESLFDLSGPAPLKMRVRGILNRTGNADDEVVFCHIETTWIMAGIGHGHTLVKTSTDLGTESQKDPSQKDSPSKAGHEHGAENLQRYSQITSENLASFHFHGQRDDYPLTAIIALPDSERSAALLEGNFLTPQDLCQIASPSQVIGDLLQVVARVQQLLDAVSLLLGVATLMLMGLVMMLSLRLRAAEIHTLKLLGASRWKIAQIMLAELTLITVASLIAALALASLLVYNLDVISPLATQTEV